MEGVSVGIIAVEVLAHQCCTDVIGGAWARVSDFSCTA